MRGCWLLNSFFPLYSQVDLLQCLEDQGPYDLIIHKLTDVITQAQDGDNKAKQMMTNLQVCAAKIVYSNSAFIDFHMMSVSSFTTLPVRNCCKCAGV